MVIWAEIVGEVEAGGCGMAGWSEAIRGIRFGTVSSARTKADAGYPQLGAIGVCGGAMYEQMFDVQTR